MVFYRLDETCVENFGSICSLAKQLWQFLYRLFRMTRRLGSGFDPKSVWSKVTAETVFG